MSSPQFLALVETEKATSPRFAGIYTTESEAWMAAENLAEDLDVIRICRRLGGQWSSRRAFKSMTWSPPEDQRQADLWEWRYRGAIAPGERDVIVRDEHAESLRALAHLRRCTEDEAMAHALRLAIDCESHAAHGHRPVIERKGGGIQVLKGWTHRRPTPPAPPPADLPQRRSIPEWMIGRYGDPEAEAPVQAPEEPKGDIGKCRSCDQVIYWRPSSKGKPCPWNADGTSHFANCPQAASHRRSRR